MSSPIALTPQQAGARAGEFTVIDVRTPGEYATGHVPGAHNIPLDRLDQAYPALSEAARRGRLLMVCASGARSERACVQLAGAGIPAATLQGGTSAWAAAGLDVERPAGARAVWPMERQVRFTAGALVLVGFLIGLRFPPVHWLSAGIGAGLVFSAVTNTCGMAAVLSKLPHNRSPKTSDDLPQTLHRLTTP